MPSGSSMTSFGRRGPKHGVPLDRREPRVDTGGDGAEPGGRDVQHEVLGQLWQHERDDVALTDALLRETGGRLVRVSVELAVAQRPTVRRDVGDIVSEPLGRLPRHLVEHHAASRGEESRPWQPHAAGRPVRRRTTASCARRAGARCRSCSTPVSTC